MKHKLQQKELSINHNLMEEAPEVAGGIAGGDMSAAIQWTLSSLFSNMEFMVELRHYSSEFDRSNESHVII